MAQLIPDILVDEQGQPVRHTPAQIVEQDIPVEGSTLSPAESLLIQDVRQREAQAYHAGQALSTLATRTTDALHLLRPQALAAFQWQKATPTQVHADVLTVHTRFQKMWTALAEENAQFQRGQQKLWAALLLSESRWKEETERARRLATSFQPLIDSCWTEAQERLQTLGVPLKAMNERLREALQPFRQTALWAQQKHQELTASLQALQARLQPFIDRINSKAFQEEGQRISDINTMVGAYCPLYRESDPAHQQDGLGQMTQDTYGKPYLPTFLASLNN